MHLGWFLLSQLASCTSMSTPELSWLHRWAVKPVALLPHLPNGGHVPTSCFLLNPDSGLTLPPSSPKTFPLLTLPCPDSGVKDFPFETASRQLSPFLSHTDFVARPSQSRERLTAPLCALYASIKKNDDDTHLMPGVCQVLHEHYLVLSQ